MDIYPSVEVTIPGFTPFWFGDNAERFGVEPEPGSGYGASTRTTWRAR